MGESAWPRGALAVGVLLPERAPNAPPFLALDVDASDPYLALDPRDPIIAAFPEKAGLIYEVLGPVGRTMIRLRGPWFRVLTGLVADENWLRAAIEAGEVEVGLATFDFEHSLRESTLPTGHEAAVVRDQLGRGVVGFVAEVAPHAIWPQNLRS